MSVQAELRGDFGLAEGILKQIAQEVGDRFTNRREHTGKDGGPIALDYSDMTDEQLDAQLSPLIKAGIVRP